MACATFQYYHFYFRLIKNINTKNEKVCLFELLAANDTDSGIAFLECGQVNRMIKWWLFADPTKHTNITFSVLVLFIVSQQCDSNYATPFFLPHFFHSNFPTADIKVLKAVIKFCIECRWLYVFHHPNMWPPDSSDLNLLAIFRLVHQKKNQQKKKQLSASKYQGYVKGHPRGH